MSGRCVFWLGLVAIIGATNASCAASDSASVQEPDSGTEQDSGEADQSVEDSQPDVTVDTQTPVDAGQDTSKPDPPDGTPTRQQCISSKFGTLPAAAFNSAKGEYRYGRMDGILVAIVAPSSKNACKADQGHVHLQVLMSGGIFDIAVNVDDEGSTGGSGIFYTTVDAAMPGGTWSEGYNTYSRLDYVGNLGLHTASFQMYTTAQLKAKVIAELETANHISIYMTPYPDGSGGHFVHYNGVKYDGAVVTHPLNAKAHFLTFRFSDQKF